MNDYSTEQDAPTGTVTFLFTDVEKGNRLWAQHPRQASAALERQEEILRAAAQANGGHTYKVIANTFQVAFSSAASAVRCALDAQRVLQAESWPTEIGEVRVRMALHTGVTEERRGDYFGPLLNRVARLLASGHGGQVLLTQATAELARSELPAHAALRDLGEHRLRDLARPEHIFQLVADDLSSEFPPLRTLENRPNNLPIQATPLVGRETAVAAVLGLLERDEVPLVTLTGPGGIGKTRLALQVAAELLDDFDDGVFFVSLGSLVDPNLVIPTIVSALGLREVGGQPLSETLRDYVRDKKLLLVLDNFEQVLSAASGVWELLSDAPRLKILATSRAPLRLSVERVYSVPSMSVPDPERLPSVAALSQYEAVALFLQRTRVLKPDFELDEQNAAAVAEICYRLEGIPLAIELAAARIRLLPPEALLTRLGSRLKLLTGGARDLPARHQTLRNTIEWSYDLLSPAERTLFVRLGVFSGGCTLEAAEGVCGSPGPDADSALAPLDLDILDGISALVDNNLLRQQEQENGDARFVMLETIHEYAVEKLEQGGELEALRGRHFDYFLGLAEEAEPQLKGADQDVWLRLLEDEHSNMRAALDWSLNPERALVGAGQTAESEEIPGALRLVGALYRFWFMHSHLTEGRKWLALALENSPESAAGRAARAKVLNGLGILTWLQGGLEVARTLLEQSLVLFRELGDKKGTGMTLNNLSIVLEDVGDYEAARSLLEESLAIKREMEDRAGVASSLANLASVLMEIGDLNEARTLAEESLGIERDLENKMNIAGRLNDLGMIAFFQGDYPRARALHEESQAIKESLGDRWGISTSLNNLANVSIAERDYENGRKLLVDSLRLNQELGIRRGIPEVLEQFAWLALELGRPDRTVTLYGATDQMRVSLAAPLPNSERERYESNLARAREQLDKAAFDKAWASGEAMSMDEAIAYALEESPGKPGVRE